jgi:hypothetical protein
MAGRNDRDDMRRLREVFLLLLSCRDEVKW